jgi:hypothetical protein
MKQLKRDLPWILPTAAILGLVLSVLGPGTLWIGWLAFALLLVLGLSVISGLWRSSDSSRSLGFMLLLAVVLRLGLGVAFSYVLPPYGNDTPVQNAGYIFSDSYQRDSQAWELASSNASLLKAFDKSYSVDQYGGLLFISSFLYRVASPDAHRPWLIILLSALISGIGVALAYKATSKTWGNRTALITGWIMALYPEAVLLGSSQMREPFLMAFISMGFWGILNWAENRRIALAWIIGSIVGLLFFSPGIAATAMVILAIWIWLVRKERSIKWWAWAGVSGIIVLAGLIFILALRGSTPVKGGLLGSLLDWFRFSANYDASILELHSGWLQTVFKALPPFLHTPFIIGYGILQPVLPAAIADPAVWPMRVLSVLRGLGWYAFLPLLVYSLRPVSKITDKRERLAWLWLWAASWGWIILSSLRAGGDQWDNPRYRVIFLIFQAALTARALVWQRANADRWLGRFVAVEGVFLLFFGYWYATRYIGWKAGQVHIFVIIVLIILVGSGILVMGWLRDKYLARRS